MKDFTTYVGMDVHKNQHHVAMLLPGSQQPKQWSIEASSAEVRRMVQRVRKDAPGPVVFCYEAGVCGFALKRLIEAQGARCIVIAPSLTPVKPGQRVHTDRRDAKGLACYLQAGMLTEVQPPSQEEEASRDLVRCRDAARKDLMRIRHQVSKLLMRRGVYYVKGKNWSAAYMRWLREVRFEQAMDEVVFRDYLAELDHRTGRLEHLDEHLKLLSQTAAYQEAVGWLRCFRGIDTVTAMVLVTELYAFGRFTSARALMSFLGLTPSESSSGESRRLGGITKAGNGLVRRVLVEAAWHQQHVPRRGKLVQARRVGQPDWVIRQAERAERRLYRRYWRLVHGGKLPVKAATAVARELAGFIWAVLFYRGPAPGDSRADSRAENPGGRKEQAKAGRG
jgi:transposase